MIVKKLARLIVALSLSSTPPAFAIVLDCEDNHDGTYTCVEISNSNAAGRASAGQTETAEGERAYIERAREACTYRKPRARAGGKGSTSALKMEAMKAAREEYERCLARKAAELKNAEQGN